MQLLKGLTSVMIVAVMTTAPAYADSLAAVPSAPTDGYSMVSWVSSMGIVEQLQTIHRFSQSSSPTALAGLMSALSSPFPLARRKAARSLLEKGRVAEGDQKRFLAQGLQGALHTSDPIVMKNMVRLMAGMNIPEAQESLRQFFTGSEKTTQLYAIAALTPEQPGNRTALQLVQQVSPYTEVRQAAQESLK